MPHLHPRSDPSRSSHLSSSSGSASESFCLSTSYSDCDSQAHHSVQPALSGKPTLETKPKLPFKADPTIYSFAWSQSDSDLENPQDFPNSNRRIVNAPVNPLIMSTSAVSGSIIARGARASKADDADDVRYLAPTLPRPIYWTSLTHPDIFKEYISNEGLAPPRSSNGVSITTEETREPFDKTYTNIKHITFTNTNKLKILPDCPTTWINEHLFADDGLPAPFKSNLVSKDSNLWSPNSLKDTGDHTFRTLPSLADEKSAMDWFNYIGNSLGVIHGLVSAIDPTNQARTNIQPGCADRAFDCEGHNKPLTKGLIQRKPDIVLIDRSFRYHVDDGIRLRWPLVQALVEITVKENQYPLLMQTLLAKASNVFDSQLHRRYILGLAFFGKGSKMKFFFTLIDRAGAVSTRPCHVRGYNAMTLARILYAFTFGSNKLLGMDTRVTIDRFTGDPRSVLVGEQHFTIITEIHVSPFLFGRGTRVYIVEDEHGHYHILKDSWILSTHEGSEIEHIKKISSIAKTAGLNDRTRTLSPRFVAGDNHVNDTAEPRGFLTAIGPARIRRRIVTGPIGDPITSYRSRFECLQALIDVVDQLEFLNDKCDLVHGDISINNIVIVRFLPSILAASNAAAIHLPLPTAGEQLADSSPSSSAEPLVATTVNPSVGNPLHFVTEANTSESWGIVQPCTSVGFPHSLASGGSVIDFDYSRPRHTLSAKTSGTMPYMSIDLMKPLQPIEHRLEHDLESVCLVLLHIARFTCGPAGNPVGKVKKSYCISQWHHEHVVELMKRDKKVDVFDMRKDPAVFISDYWTPIAPYITQLLDVVYPGSNRFEMEPGRATCKMFKEVLIAARDHCKGLPENTPNYAAFAPSRKRPRTKSLAQDRGERKHRRPLTADHADVQIHPRSARVLPFSQYMDPVANA